MIYLTVLISSSSGDRKDTRFTAGNIGRPRDFLGESVDCTGLFVRIDDNVRESLYGIRVVAESVDEAEKADPVDGVDSVSGVLALSCLTGVAGADQDTGAGTALFMDNRGLDGFDVDVGPV